VDGPAGDFSAFRAIESLRVLLGNGAPHPIGSDANVAVRERIVQTLRELGYNPELHSELVCDRSALCAMPVNILVRVEGVEPDSRGSVLLSAHYDSVPAGPGASDDGAGVASIIEIARILKVREKPRHSVVLLFNEGEEAGLLGAELFVQRHRWAHTVKAVVNLEARGTSGTSFMFETGTANRWLMNLYANSIPSPLTNSIWYSLYTRLPNGTDFRIFKASGYQGYNFAFIDHVAEYHTPFDDIQHIDVRSFQEQGDHALEALLALANSDLEQATEGKAAFFDVFGLVLVRVPMAAILPAGLSALLLSLTGILWLLRRREIRLAELSWALGGTVLALCASAVFGTLLLITLKAIVARGVPRFVAYPSVMISTFCALAVLILWAWNRVFGKRVTFWAHWCACAVWFSLLAALLATSEPGAAYLPLIPAIVLVAGIALRSMGVLRGAIGQEFLTLAFLLVMFVLLMPLLLQLYPALGTIALPLLTVLIVFGTTPFLGLLIRTPVAVGRTMLIGAGGCLMVGLGLILALPVYSVDSPDGLNITYQRDATASEPSQARWLVQTRSGRVADEFRDALKLEPLNARRFPWDRGEERFFSATAPILDLTEPQLTILSATDSGLGATAKRRVRYHAHLANKSIPFQMVAFSPEAELKFLSLRPANADAAEPKELELSDWEGWKVLRLVAMAPSGTDLWFEAADVDFDMLLVEKRFGLPGAGAEILRMRLQNTTPINEGNVSVATKMLHVPRQTLLVHEAPR